MEDGTGAVVTLPTMPALQSAVDAMLSEGSGAVAAAQTSASAAAASASESNGYAQESLTHSQESQGFADEALTHATDAAGSAQASEMSAAASSASAAAASESKDAAASSATTAGDKATQAVDSAAAASASADASAASSASAQGYATDSFNSAAEAHSWALTAQTTVTGLLHYMGAHDASSGSFPADPNKGDFWKISVAGVVDSTDLAVGDQIIYSGSGWDKIDNTESVTAVAGKVGDISLEIADVGGLQSALAGKAPTVHTHGIADVSGLQSALDDKPSLTSLNTFSNTNFFYGPTALIVDGSADSRITFDIDGHRRGLLSVNAAANQSSWVVYDADGGTALGQLTIGAGGMQYKGGITFDCSGSSTDNFSVNQPGSSPAGSSVAFSSPQGLPGILGMYANSKRRDIIFSDLGVQFGVSGNTAGHAPQFTFGEDGIGRAVDWEYTSDIRVKENIRPLVRGLAELKKMPPVQYEKYGRPEAGHIAQAVRQVMSEAVSGDPDDPDGLLTVSGGQIIALLSACILELDKRLCAVEGKSWEAPDYSKSLK